MTDPKKTGLIGRETLGLLAFLLLACAQTSNMILARGVAGTVPPFSLAFFRWSIVAIGLLPAVIAAFRADPKLLRADAGKIVVTGFLGMFVCGAPVYVAAQTTSAISLALIMSLSPLVVLVVSWLMRLEKINRGQLLGMLTSLAGAALIVTRGHSSAGDGPALGDLLVTMAMLAWAGYTLLQNRVAPGIGFLARIGLFAGSGALFSLPFAVHEIMAAPAAALSLHAASAYLFAGLVPGLFAYGAYAYLGSMFGPVSTALSLYLGPIVSAVLSIVFLGEAPTIIHLIGGALSLGGLWLSMRSRSAVVSGKRAQ